MALKNDPASTVPRRPAALAFVAAAALLTLGGAATSTGATTARRFKLSSPALSSGAPKLVPRRYTCDGGETSLPLSWRDVPGGTKELVVFVANSGTSGSEVDWAVAGLKPSSHGLSAGRLPQGAIVGRNSHGKTGYTVCPAHHTTEMFGIAVYALPHRISLKRGFKGPALLNAVSHGSPVALMVVTYKRR